MVIKPVILFPSIYGECLPNNAPAKKGNSANEIIPIILSNFFKSIIITCNLSWFNKFHQLNAPDYEKVVPGLRTTTILFKSTTPFNCNSTLLLGFLPFIAFPIPYERFLPVQAPQVHGSTFKVPN